METFERENVENHPRILKCESKEYMTKTSMD
jgi:hypothetical protein